MGLKKTIIYTLTAINNYLTEKKIEVIIKSDSNLKRATFGVNYIYEKENDIVSKDSIDVLLKRKDDEKLYAFRKKFKFSFVGNIVNVLFKECSFYYNQGKDISILTNLTFKNCDFESCFMGSIHFKNVRFKDCAFIRTDFMNTKFEDCTFEDCDFQNCTAAYSSFVNTEIDPNQFMQGVPCPIYNYNNLTNPDISKLKREWTDIRFQVATSLFRSNTNLAHSKFSDFGLYQLKKADLDYKFHSIDLSAITNNVFLILSCLKIWLNLKLTKGGVSLNRLIVIAIIFTLIINLCLMNSDVCYNDYQLSISPHTSGYWFADYFKTIPYSVSLFLGFGFTNFKTANHNGDYWLILVACLGIVWYSLLIPMIIRKVYR